MIFLFILLIMLVLDLYTYKGIRVILSKTRLKWFRKTVFTIHWAVSLFMFLLVLSGYFLRSSTRNIHVFLAYYYLFGAFLVIYVPKIVFVVFHFLEDILFGIKWLFVHLTRSYKPRMSRASAPPMSRSKFLSVVGVAAAAVPFTSFIWGIAKGRFDFRVRKVRVGFPDLPPGFNGIRIVQVSDIHTGSFEGYESQVERAISMVNAQNADYMFFTGDLVNNFYDELKGDWIPILSKMKARYGKYSCLGNHDYGNYYDWKSEKNKLDNFHKIVKAYGDIGFHLLRNESVKLEQGGDVIGLVGVENWGKKPFPQLGDYPKAAKDVQDIPFKILMSHDPTHWDMKIQGKQPVQLTLSGHTHGMQFGVKLGNRRWSPASFKYPHWGGLYRVGPQYLYVNRGLGYIGYPGRVGMPPEITVMELYKKDV